MNTPSVFFLKATKCDAISADTGSQVDDDDAKALEYAATKIQAGWKGYKTRKEATNKQK